MEPDNDLRVQASSELRGLLCELYNFRIDMFAQNSHTAPPSIPAKRKAFDCDNSIEDIWQDIHSLDTAFTPVRNQILDKWSAKIKMASGGSNSKLKAVDTPATTQISNLLADMDRLVKRSQLMRSEYNIIGESNVVGDPEYNPEIFDGIGIFSCNHLDQDFYAMMLKEFVESRQSVDGVMGTVMLTLQILWPCH